MVLCFDLFLRRDGVGVLLDVLVVVEEVLGGLSVTTVQQFDQDADQETCDCSDADCDQQTDELETALAETTASWVYLHVVVCVVRTVGGSGEQD